MLVVSGLACTRTTFPVKPSAKASRVTVAASSLATSAMSVSLTAASNSIRAGSTMVKAATPGVSPEPFSTVPWMVTMPSKGAVSVALSRLPSASVSALLAAVTPWLAAVRASETREATESRPRAAFAAFRAALACVRAVFRVRNVGSISCRVALSASS